MRDLGQFRDACSRERLFVAVLVIGDVGRNALLRRLGARRTRPNLRRLMVRLEAEAHALHVRGVQDVGPAEVVDVEA